jgi:hypothetical protein
MCSGIWKVEFIAFNAVSNASLAIVLRKISTVSQEFPVVLGADAEAEVFHQYFSEALTCLHLPKKGVLAFAGNLSCPS